MEISEVKRGNSIQSTQKNSNKQLRETSEGNEVDERLDDLLNQKQDIEEFTREDIEEGVETLNETIKSFHKDLSFELHESSERMMAKLINIKENEVIKEIPPEEVLDMLGSIREAVGLIIDEKI